MIESEKFGIGYFKTDMQDGMEIFVSVTPYFEYGPGIQRDGITAPRMTDPRSVDYIATNTGIQCDPNLNPTQDPYAQRMGTYTLYHHLRDFINAKGKEWRIVAVQSNGDLTMNPWHVAYIGKNTYVSNKQQKGIICGLFTKEDPNPNKEPVDKRTYRCLVKWNDEVCKQRRTNIKYEFLFLKFSLTEKDNFAYIGDPKYIDLNKTWLSELNCYDEKTKSYNITNYIEFAFSGKTIIKKGFLNPLSRAVDKFQDVRHVFNLPKVSASGSYEGIEVKKLNLGEYQLYSDLNARRLALFAPVIVDLSTKDSVKMNWVTVRNELIIKHHYTEVLEHPRNQNEFRRYPDDENKIEIFFPKATYPFGVIGIRSKNTGEMEEMVSFVSGGLSGRVGNTLEGIGDIMFNHFRCTDALVLDEGLDSFLLVNPKENNSYKYTNGKLLEKVLAFTKKLADEEDKDSTTFKITEQNLNDLRSKIPESILKKLENMKDREITGEKDFLKELKKEIKNDQTVEDCKLTIFENTKYRSGLKSYALNNKIFPNIDEEHNKIDNKTINYSDIFIVKPQRSQIRSVIIFAVPERVLQNLS